jgi:uncharacterized membrane protein YbhN (UPF0104 family)
VVGWTGTGPFVEGVRSLDSRTLALGALLAVPTTLACAWRWHLVAGGLGVAVGVRQAVAACYRAQFLNTVLPGGVLGDVHRGLVHGRQTHDSPRALRAVGWERLAGQVVQAVIAVLILVALPAPARAYLPVGGAVLALVLVVGLGATLVTRVRHDVVHGLLARRVWPGVVLASVVAVAGYGATYLVAARATGVTSPLRSLLPVVMLVLVAAALPLNLAGWGPREGMAAWAFGATGLGADRGVATATAYGVMVLVASLPGALVLVLSTRRKTAQEVHQ